jgi:hypothetical protein
MQHTLHDSINRGTSDAHVMQICIFIGHYVSRKCNRQPELNLHRMPIKLIFCHDLNPRINRICYRWVLEIINDLLIEVLKLHILTNKSCCICQQGHKHT